MPSLELKSARFNYAPASQMKYIFLEIKYIFLDLVLKDASQSSTSWIIIIIQH